MPGYHTCPVCRETFWRDEDWKTLCLSCWKDRQGIPKSGRPRVARDPHPLSVVVDDTMLRRLIQLCHPDKHQQSEASKEVTQWLLEIKAYRKR